ncbi:MAG: hypothetical protein ACK4I8_02405 [Armatimonadota bacterium]
MMPNDCGSLKITSLMIATISLNASVEKIQLRTNLKDGAVFRESQWENDRELASGCLRFSAVALPLH